MYRGSSYSGDIYRNRSSPTVGEGQPYQLYKNIQNVGKTVESSKKKITWTFTFGEDDSIHSVVLEHSAISGKKRLFLNGDLIFESQKVGNFDWSHGWPMGSHVCRCDILGEGNYELTIDAKRFGLWPKTDRQLLQQLAVAKKESEKTLLQDEQRRLDMISAQRSYDLENQKAKGQARSIRIKSDPTDAGEKISSRSKSLKNKNKVVDILSEDIPLSAPHTSQPNYDPPLSTRSQPPPNASMINNELLQVGIQMQHGINMNRSVGTAPTQMDYYGSQSSAFSAPAQNSQGSSNLFNTWNPQEYPQYSQIHQMNHPPQPPIQNVTPVNQNTMPNGQHNYSSVSSHVQQSHFAERPAPLYHSQSHFVPGQEKPYSSLLNQQAALGISTMNVDSGRNKGFTGPLMTIDSAFQTKEEVYQQRQQFMRQPQLSMNYMTTQYPSTVAYNVPSSIPAGYHTNVTQGSYSFQTVPEQMNFPIQPMPPQQYGTGI